MIPRILYSLLRMGSARMAWMTEPPWLPVAPNTVISLVIFIVVKERLGSSEMDLDAQNLIKKVGFNDQSTLAAGDIGFLCITA